MSPQIEENVVSYPPSVLDEPGAGRRLRYMRRRRIGKADRSGDPLDGVVNLFDVAIVLAVAFLLAALAGVGLSGILSSENMTIVTNPGQADMQVITKTGSEIKRLDLQTGAQASGMGTLIGQFYLLADGTTVYVPAGGTTVPGSASTPLPSTSPLPGASPTAPGTAVTPTAPPAVATPTPSAFTIPPSTQTPPPGVPTTEPGKKGGDSAGP